MKPLPLAVALAADKSTAKALRNTGVVARIRKKVLDEGDQRARIGLKQMGQYSEFYKVHKPYVRRSFITDIVVITLQSDGMRRVVMQEGLFSSNSPTSGIVTDAAHKFWKERNALLITSSAYSEFMESWVPIACSYSNGASAGHYEVHFQTLFAGIEAEKKKSGMMVVDDDLKQVFTFTASLQSVLTLLRSSTLAQLKGWGLNKHSSHFPSREVTREVLKSWRAPVRNL
jgi:hypothetical protein